MHLEEILYLIEQKKYFILQTGKTSGLLALMAHINQNYNLNCIYMNVECAQTARENENVHEGMKSVIQELAIRSKIYLNNTLIENMLTKLFDETANMALFLIKR